MDGASLPSYRPSTRNCRRPFSEVGPTPAPLVPFHPTPRVRSSTCPPLSCPGIPPGPCSSLPRDIGWRAGNNPARVLASIPPLALLLPLTFRPHLSQWGALRTSWPERHTNVFCSPGDKEEREVSW